jgi:hypothetical protein
MDWDRLNMRWVLSIRGFHKGVYLLRVHKNGKTETAQIVIQ